MHMQAVENMCVHKRAGSLYDKLRGACDIHTKGIVSGLSEHLSHGDVQFLAAVDAAWRQHCEQMMLIRAIFMYLDRSYVAVVAEAKARSIFDMGLRQFRTHLEGNDKVRPFAQGISNPVAFMRPYTLAMSGRGALLPAHRF